VVCLHAAKALPIILQALGDMKAHFVQKFNKDPCLRVPSILFEPPPFRLDLSPNGGS
jgi:hypothetical protein